MKLRAQNIFCTLALTYIWCGFVVLPLMSNIYVHTYHDGRQADVRTSVRTWNIMEAEAKIELPDLEEVQKEGSNNSENTIIPRKSVGEIVGQIPEASSTDVYLFWGLVVFSAVGVGLWATKVYRERKVNRWLSAFLIIIVSITIFLSPYSRVAPEAPEAEAAILPTYQTKGTMCNTAGNCTVSLPAHRTNDILLIILETQANDTPGTPSGWAHIADSPNSLQSGTAGASTKLTIYWKRAASSSETNPVVTDAGDHIFGQAMVFRGVIESGDPWDVTSATTGTGTGTFNITGDTTTVANALIVVAVAASRDSAQTDTTFANWSNGDLANLTERTDQTFGGANGGGIGVLTAEKAAAGSYGNTSVDITQGAAEDWAAITLALKPQVDSPIEAFDLTYGVDNTTASSYTTASISPGANRLVLLTVGHADTAGGEVPTASGAGLTFTQLETRVVSNRRLTLFHALSSSPSSGVVTISYASNDPTSVAWSIVEFSGVETSGTNGAGAIAQSEQDGSASASSGSVTLSSFGSSDNATFMAVEAVDAIASFTYEQSYAQFHFQSGTGSYSIGTAWNDENDTSPSADWGAARQWGIFGVEIKADIPYDAAAVKIRGGTTIRGGAIFR